jgi:hypothetical protein
MNRYILIRRLRGPAILLLLGVLALLDEMGVIDGFWGLFWPLLLILIGVMLLAERAALAMEGYDPQMPYSCAPWGSGPYAGTPGAQATPTTGEPGTAMVPAENPELTHGQGNSGDGGTR